MYCVVNEDCKNLLSKLHNQLEREMNCNNNNNVCILVYIRLSVFQHFLDTSRLLILSKYFSLLGFQSFLASFVTEIQNLLCFTPHSFYGCHMYTLGVFVVNHSLSMSKSSKCFVRISSIIEVLAQFFLDQFKILSLLEIFEEFYQKSISVTNNYDILD